MGNSCICSVSSLDTKHLCKPAEMFICQFAKNAHLLSVMITEFYDKVKICERFQCPFLVIKYFRYNLECASDYIYWHMSGRHILFFLNNFSKSCFFAKELYTYFVPNSKLFRLGDISESAQRGNKSFLVIFQIMHIFLSYRTSYLKNPTKALPKNRTLKRTSIPQ